MIDWPQIDTVLLDMDGTLLDLHFDNYFWLDHLPRRYSELKGLPLAESHRWLQQQASEAKGSLDWYCLDFWQQKLDVDIVALKREIDHLIVLRPYVEEFLLALQAMGKQVLLVTNAHGDSLSLKMQQVDLTPWFDGVVVSHDYRQPKESQDFWRQLQQQYCFDPRKTLFIDDTETILASAQQYGIRHLLTLVQPDSQSPKRLSCQFPSIHHFNEIIPEYQGSQ